MPRTPKSSDGATGSPKPVARSKKGNGSPAAVADHDVARRAYEIYENRGGEHGFDIDDWLEAERQLKPGPSSVTGPKPRRRRAQGDMA